MIPDANVFTTLARAPGLFRRWLAFAGRLLGGKLPPRDRELLILRTAWNCGCEYEWGHHEVIGREAGLSDGDIKRVTSGSRDGWPPLDATLLRAADELHDQRCITDSTWTELTGRYDTEQLIELPMLVGHYQLLAMTLNSLGVQLDPGLAGFPP